MKRFDVKSIFLGVTIGTIGITTVFASGGIKSSILSNAQVALDGANLSLENPLVAIVKDGEINSRLYMPIRELLEKIGYTANWDVKQNTVNLISNMINVKL